MAGSAADLCYINGLYAEIYYVLDGLLARISCLGDKVEFQLGDENPVVLTALDKGIVSSEKVIMADFVKWAKENLFYTIVTNYSLQAFNANDYKRERCLVLGNQNSKKEAEDDADGKIWMNSLFHKK